jgi:hypothetical protein
VWRTVHHPGKEPERKGRVVVDIRGLNRITEVESEPKESLTWDEFLAKLRRKWENWSAKFPKEKEGVSSLECSVSNSA